MAGLAHHQTHPAIVQHQSGARLQSGEHLRMRQMNVGRAAGRPVEVQMQSPARLDIDPATLEDAKPELGTLQIGKDSPAARPISLLSGPDIGDGRWRGPHGRRVAEIEAEDVNADPRQIERHRRAPAGRAEGGDDAGAARADHALVL